jgi:hypothetical protein
LSFIAKGFKAYLKQAALCAAMLLVPSASFAMDAQDISIALRVLLLMEEKYTGSIPVAVVYNPAVPSSLSDAENIKKSIEAGVGMPEELKFNAYLVSVAHADKLSGAKVAFLADNLPSDSASAVCDAAVKEGILTISSNINCVRANKCVVGIISKPSIEIYYSPVAAEASHLSFSSAFIMLVKPI